MEITEVRIKLVHDVQERLLAFCSITIDAAFVIRDLKLINGSKGPFVAMPSRKLTSKCSNCHFKNPVDSAFCSNCGTRLRDEEAIRRLQRETKIHFDVAHPINPHCRQQIETAVMAAYQQAVQSGTSHGSRREDEFD